MGSGKKKRKLKKGIVKKMIVVILFILCLVMLGIIVKLIFFDKVKMYDKYIGSKDISVKLFDLEYNESTEIYRGVKVSVYDKEYKNNDILYKKIKYNDTDYYILDSNLVSEEKDTVMEKTLYVRTPITVYKDINKPDILGFLKKGSKIDIVGFDKLEKGVVHMYKIKYDDTFGYVYSKYLVDNLELANKVYDEAKTYAYHKDRKFSYELYGGYASELDYYPYEKASFKNNVMPNETKTLYLNASVLSNIDNYISLAKSSSINAFVVDIYDGYLAYPSKVAEEYSPSAYASARWTMEEYKNVIDKLLDNGFYVIGRIVAFNNPHFAKDNTSDAISYAGRATSWVSAYSRRAWEYNVKLAIEAISEFKFNEIQYDYVRFPESSYSWSKNSNYDFKNTYNESKGEAIQNFLFYATDRIHETNTYISADVFGEAAYAYVTAYGQYWPAISNIVDVISAMPYPDHFNKYDFGIKVPVWTVPYDLMSSWSKYASERQKEISTPAKVRTWIQAYDAIREPYITYGANEVSAQIKALYENELDNGFITWNAGSNITKYTKISDAFKKDYR